MSRYEKRTNNYHRQLTSKRECKKQLQAKKKKELKSITIEFRTSKHTELFYPFMFKVIQKEGLDKYFTNCKREGNTIYFYTQCNKKYVEEDYMGLAVKLAESINQYENYGNELPIDDVLYGNITLYTRKSRKHLYIGINYYETASHNLLSGEKKIIGISEYEEEYDIETDSEYEDDDWW